MVRAHVIAGCIALASAAADASVTKVEIQRRVAFADGQAFGAAGPYERLTGKFHGELDPDHPLNRVIVDIASAPRNTRGRVEYRADFDILKPLDMTKGSGTLLYDVNNRGRKVALGNFNDARASTDPLTAADAGNGFLMREGFTLVWSGWIHDLPPVPGLLRAEVPAAPGLRQNVWDEFLPNTAGETTWRLSFKAAVADKSRAVLHQRHRNTEPAAIVPPSRWEFVDEQTIRLLPAGTAFRIGAIYQFVYPAADPPVSGIGFAATRDLVAFLRNEAGDANPLAGGIKRALAHGTSQSGRYLRDFLYRGFNEDEAGNKVFDALHVHIATARLFLNQRFAQPNRMIHLGHGFQFFPDTSFPFAYQNETDPFSGATDGLLHRCTARGNCPKIIHTTSGVEYWQSGESLITTDPQGRRDAALPDGVRVYHMAGTQHVLGQTMPNGVCALPPNNVIDPRPVLRALLVAMDRWVRDGAAPPPSRYPRLDDGTLVPMAQWRFPALPGVQKPARPNGKPRFDYGPEFAKGIIARVLPETLKGQYPVLVPQVDSDGNEVGGVRVPEQAVPLATSTGWALRSPDAGGAGALCYLDGSYVPFSRNAAERKQLRDPRSSAAERYQGSDDYLSKVKTRADELLRGGYLLDEDAQRILKRAANARW